MFKMFIVLDLISYNLRVFCCPEWPEEVLQRGQHRPGGPSEGIIKVYKTGMQSEMLFITRTNVCLQ